MSSFLPLLPRRLIHSLPSSSLRRHQIQQEVLGTAGTAHPPNPPQPFPMILGTSGTRPPLQTNNPQVSKPYLLLSTSLETLKSQNLTLEAREAELRKSLQDSADAKRVLIGVIGELNGRVEKLECSPVVEELQRRVEKLHGQTGVVEALERRAEKLETQGGRKKHKRSGWLTFALLSSSALFCADIAVRLAGTPKPGKKKILVEGKAG
ncbi:hypothetical protein K440DRAFT_630896, partial [Wilcoxina mikolae CBS 423.85]